MSGLHAVAEVGPLVRVAQTTGGDTNAETTDIVVIESSREAVSVRVGGGNALIVARVTLQNIAIDRLRLHVMELLRRHVSLAEGTLALDTGSTGVHAVLNAVDVGQGIGLVNWLRHMASARAGSMLKSNGLIAQSRHVDQGLLVVEAAATSTTEMIHLFALQLVLDTLPVGSITDQREYRTNALNKEGALLGLRVVQSSLERLLIVASGNKILVTNLNTIVAVRVAEKLLKTSAIQKFLDKELPSAVFCNTNALRENQPRGKVSD